MKITLPLLFAQTAPPNHGDWLTNLNFFLTLIIALAVTWSFLTNRPQRREVSFQTEFATKTELKRIEDEQTRFAQRRDIERIQADNASISTEIKEMRAEWRCDKDEIIRISEDRASKIHDRINCLSVDLTEAVSEIRGELKRIHDH